MINEIEQHVPFETLLSEISTLFFNLPADRFDSEIENAQRRICEFLSLDGSALWEARGQEPGSLVLTYAYQPPKIPQLSKGMDARDFFPWAVQRILRGEVVVISKISDIPEEAGRDRENCRLHGIKSALTQALDRGARNNFDQR